MVVIMLGNFIYHNPTKLLFGKSSIDMMKDELNKYGDNILLIYGKGSIKNNGIYDKVINILKNCNKNVIELSEVMPNPTAKKLDEGRKVAKENDIDFILAVGGGSVIDYAKGVSATTHFDGNAWEHFYINMNDPKNKVIPMGCILTMVGTGSEMNGGSVITDEESGLKIGKVFGAELFPKFAVLDPTYTFTTSKYQMTAGIFDIMSHIMEQYFSGDDDNVSDYIAEALMKSIIRNSRIAYEDPSNYEARSNIMWASTWALNTLIGMGKEQDWMVHMIGQAIGGVTDATHGMTLASVSLPYYRMVMEEAPEKFKKFAVNVFGVADNNKSDMEIAKEGLEKLEEWMKELNLVLDPREIGVNNKNIEKILDGVFILDGGYKKLTRDDIKAIILH